MFQVVRSGAKDLDELPSRLATGRRHLDAQFFREIAAGERCWSILDLLVGSGGDDLSTVLARTRAEIEDAVRGAHDIGIVLDHQDRVSQLAQIVKDLDQTMRVPAVQPNRRLIQNIKCANQA